MTSSAVTPTSDTLTVLVHHARVLVALDFDGTLAHLVDNPDDARMTPQCRGELLRLTDMAGVTVALVSGRSINDLKRVAEPDPRWWLVGSHGVEIVGPEGTGVHHTPEPDAAKRDALWRAFDEVATQFSGVWVEHKSQGAALHTRGVNPEVEAEAQHMLLAVIATFGEGLTTRRGHGIVETSLGAAGKGDGVHALREAVQPGLVIFMGDDLTDEDGFAALGPGDIGVKVGEGHTMAQFRVADAEEVAVFLAAAVHALSAR